jgi:hypothetical protein
VKIRPIQARASAGQEGQQRGKRRVVAVRRIEPERPLRVWSLLLPPSFPAERK